MIAEVSQALQKVVELQRSRKVEAVGGFRELVRSLADSKTKPPTPSQIEAILIASGKTVDDLESDLQIAIERNAHRATAAKMDAAEASKAGVEAKITAANKVLEAAKAKHAELVGPLNYQLDNILKAHNQGDFAVIELDGFIWPEFEEEREELRQSVTAAGTVAEESRKHLEAMKSRLNSERSNRRGESYSNPEAIAKYASQVERAERAYKEATEARDNAVREQEEFVARMRSL